MPKVRTVKKPVTRRPRLPDGEKRISAKEAGGLLIPPRPPTTIYNWMYVGFNGATLEFERQVGLVFTSPEALERFLERTGQS